jgi:hypothetical protein
VCLSSIPSYLRHFSNPLSPLRKHFPQQIFKNGFFNYSPKPDSTTVSNQTAYMIQAQAGTIEKQKNKKKKERRKKKEKEQKKEQKKERKKERNSPMAFNNRSQPRHQNPHPLSPKPLKPRQPPNAMPSPHRRHLIDSNIQTRRQGQ